MKKQLAVLAMLIALLATMVSCQSTPKKDPSTEDQTHSENPATDFQYEISEDGEAVYINAYIGTAEHVIIPSTIEGKRVTSLKGTVDQGSVVKGVFEGSQIKTVTIPAGVTAIGRYAFKNCDQLTSVTMSPDIDMILSSAFENCTKLEVIDLSKTSVSTLSRDAFKGCTSLQEIKLPECLVEIQQGCFYNCSALKELQLPPSLLKIEAQTVVNCTALKEITVPAKLDLSSLTDSVPFYNMPSLEKIIFEEGRVEITGYAFFDTTSAVEIIIPASVQKFSSAPFFIHGSARFVFLGDCPEVVEKQDFYGDPTICYDPETKGWENCIWKNQYPLEPK